MRRSDALAPLRGPSVRRAAGLALTLALALATAAGAADRSVVTLGTATPGGGFPVYGEAVAETVNALDPVARDPAAQHQGQHRERAAARGGHSSTSALVQGEVAHEALSGIGRAAGRPALIAAMYSTAGMFVVRADCRPRDRGSARASRSRSARAARGSSILARYVLDGLGLDQERDFQAVYLDRAGDGPAMVLDGRVAALWGGGIGWPGFTAVGRRRRAARASSRPTPTRSRRIQAKHAFLKPMSVPAGSLSRPGRGDRLGRLVELHHGAARRSPDDAAYRLARALHRGRGRARPRGCRRRPTRRRRTRWPRRRGPS